jgi:hypothetical protein
MKWAISEEVSPTDSHMICITWKSLENDLDVRLWPIDEFGQVIVGTYTVQWS